MRFKYSLSNVFKGLNIGNFQMPSCRVNVTGCVKEISEHPPDKNIIIVGKKSSAALYWGLTGTLNLIKYKLFIRINELFYKLLSNDIQLILNILLKFYFTKIFLYPKNIIFTFSKKK